MHLAAPRPAPVRVRLRGRAHTCRSSRASGPRRTASEVLGLMHEDERSTALGEPVDDIVRPCARDSERFVRVVRPDRAPSVRRPSARVTTSGFGWCGTPRPPPPQGQRRVQDRCRARLVRYRRTRVPRRSDGGFSSVEEGRMAQLGHPTVRGRATPTTKSMSVDNDSGPTMVELEPARARSGRRAARSCAGISAHRRGVRRRTRPPLVGDPFFRILTGSEVGQVPARDHRSIVLGAEMHRTSCCPATAFHQPGDSASLDPCPMASRSDPTPPADGPTWHTRPARRQAGEVRSGRTRR